MLTLAPASASAAPTAVVGQANAGNRILFLVVVRGADSDCLEDPRPAGPRYTRDSLRSLLQLLGCKPRVAYKIMLAVFQAVDQAVINARQQRISRKTFQVHPHRNGKVYVSLTRADFMLLVSTCAAQYSYKISPSSDELKVACSLRERRRCVVVLLSGTSGSGKSTLASILANRLGITTVISTDSIRHMLRSFNSKESAPLIWASTYQAGEAINPVKGGEVMSESERALSGYKAQCELLAQQLETLIAGCEERQQSLICEGVHLNISTVLKLMSRHPDVVPFLVHIASEDKHVERMAVRAKYMTLDPHKNRYVRYMGNIRLIQEYLVRKADKYAIPRVENSNVDRSVGIIHLTVMGCLRRMAKGESVLDHATGRAHMLAAEYAAVLEHLQGEKERVVAKVTSSTSADPTAASSSKQQQQQQPGAAAAAASNGAGSNGSSSKMRHRRFGSADHALPPAAEVLGGGQAAAAAGSSRRSIDLPLPPSVAAAAAVAIDRPAGRRKSLEQLASVQQQQSLEAPISGKVTVTGSTSSSNQQAAAAAADSSISMQQLAAALPQLPAKCTGQSHAAMQVAAAAGVAAAAAEAIPSNTAAAAAADGDVLMSPDGPVMRWEKFLLAGKLSPGDDGQLAGSPGTPLAAAGLAMAWPHGSSSNIGQTHNHQQQQGISSANISVTSVTADGFVSLGGTEAHGLAAAAAAAGMLSSSDDQHSNMQLQGSEHEGPEVSLEDTQAVDNADNVNDADDADDADIDADSVDGDVSEADNILSPSSGRQDSGSRQQQLLLSQTAAGTAARRADGSSQPAAAVQTGVSSSSSLQAAGSSTQAAADAVAMQADNSSPAASTSATVGWQDDGNSSSQQAAARQASSTSTTGVIPAAQQAGSSSSAAAAATADTAANNAGSSEEDNQPSTHPNSDLEFSSGEELDELGDLNSSDGEGERFLIEYGSMCESTTCDEHDEEDIHDMMGHVGLRAWNGGMARALWPSYHHVYNSSGRWSGVNLVRGVQSADGSSNARPGAADSSSNGVAPGHNRTADLSRNSLGRVAEDSPFVAASAAATDVDSGSHPQSGLPPLSRSSSAAANGTAAGSSRLMKRSGSSGYGRGVGSRGSRQRRSGSGGLDVSSLQQFSGLRSPQRGLLSPSSSGQQHDQTQQQQQQQQQQDAGLQEQQQSQQNVDG